MGGTAMAPGLLASIADGLRMAWAVPSLVELSPSSSLVASPPVFIHSHSL